MVCNSIITQKSKQQDFQSSKFKLPGYSSSGQDSHSSRSLRELVTLCPQLEKKRAMNKCTLSIQLAFPLLYSRGSPAWGVVPPIVGRSKIIPHRHAQRSFFQVIPGFVKLIICTSHHKASDLPFHFLFFLMDTSVIVALRHSYILFLSLVQRWGGLFH